MITVKDLADAATFERLITKLTPVHPTREHLEDAYYDELGEIIEKHPIGAPGVVRYNTRR